MPNIDSLVQTISQTLQTASQETAYFKTLDLQYAYSQLNFYSDTARHCNFKLVSGDMNGTYRFKPGFYGLTDMPAEFQKAIDCTLAGLNNTFFFGRYINSEQRRNRKTSRFSTKMSDKVRSRKSPNNSC